VYCLRIWILPLAALGALALLTRSLSADDATKWVITPAAVAFDGNFARTQLVVTEPDSAGTATERSDDLTGQVQFSSSDPAIATVSPSGEVLAAKDGQATITIARGDAKREVPVTVSGVVEHPVVRFGEQIRPILSKAGCATAACHASQHGKAGFKLSVFGFEPDKDRQAIVRDSIGRRVNFVEPERSLVVLKPTMQTPHGGGKRIEKGSVEHQVLLAWIASGAPGPSKDDAEVTRLHVFPARRVGQVGMSQQLRVEAEYSDGKRRDVTAWAKFDSLDDGVLTVTPAGRVTTVGKGQAPVMIRYEGQAETSLFVVPFSEHIELAGWQNQNFIDELAAAKFRELGIEPSPRCDDATFIRRARCRRPTKRAPFCKRMSQTSGSN
jgi:Big-like domain-containing protein